MSNRGRHKKINRPIKSWLLDVLSKEVILKIIQNQVDQGNPANIRIFEEDPWAGQPQGGFCFAHTPEGSSYWHYVADTINNFKYAKYINESRKT